MQEKSNNTDLLPANLIDGEEDDAGIIKMCNELVLDRNRILKSATPTNPSVLKMDQQIASLKQNLIPNLTFSKEGKTFVSANLAATFALSGKKVLLIGMDIRNPKLDDYFSLPDQGLTNYLSNKDILLENLIIKQKGYENFHILPAGLIPPNPAELLLSQKVDTLFKTVKAQYDYIIVILHR